MLNTLTVGHGPVRLVFVHGLFGQGKNFRQIAKALDDRATSLLVDLPNHGHSEWTEVFDYSLFAEMLAETIRAWAGDEPVCVIGHSMGGKVTMRMVLEHPEIAERLVVLDSAPANFGDPVSFAYLIDSLRALNLDEISSRAEADQALRGGIPEDGVRAFLLQSLDRTDEGWRWLFNLELLQGSMDIMSGWQGPSIQPDGTPDVSWDRPVLWIIGALSRLQTELYLHRIRAFFPKTTTVSLPLAGHWVHSDAPDVVTRCIARFIET